ncbi:MAG TPA: anaerobic ribonucleoside-triphosphate reductase activating protein [Anaerolineae bacterium]|nr:anaerobic ribonucleoside-triphosphate reductase activating protein [Anaerolineae bacterium]
MHVKGWVKSSLLDFPGRIAASLFSGGCNFRCPNCHNAELVLYPERLADLRQDEIWAFLKQRRGLLDGVVLSGGEPTLQPDLLAFAARLHQLGFLVKLDTNGYLPDVLQEAIEDRLVDYVAMDVKASLPKYVEAAGTAVDTARVGRSIDILLRSDIEYEFRTTVVPGILDEEDVVHIGEWIAGARAYYLQQFVPRNTLDPAMLEQEPYPSDRIRAMAKLVEPYVQLVQVRGL